VHGNLLTFLKRLVLLGPNLAFLNSLQRELFDHTSTCTVNGNSLPDPRTKREVRDKSQSTEKLAVRAQTDELKTLRVRFAVDQKQVGFEVALSMVAPVSSQSMIMIFFRQRLVVR